MTISPIDCNRVVGNSILGTFAPHRDAAELCHSLSHDHCAGSLIWHFAQKEATVKEGNEKLQVFLDADNHRYGLFALTPEMAEDCASQDFFAHLRERTAFRGFTLFPGPQRFSLENLALQPFFDAIQEEGMPLYLSMLHASLEWKSIYSLLKRFPRLNCILADLEVYGECRHYRPLLKAYSGFRLETSLLSVGYGLIEDLVSEHGAHHFVFGSGFPYRIPSGSLFHLRHSLLDEKSKQMIARENILNLIL